MKDLPTFPAIEHDRPPSDDPRFSREELQLAFRNRGMPLEALRFPVTPDGLHYLLTHFDIPVAGPGWRLEIAGLVSRPLSLKLADIKARPARTRRVTLECAGNGRALMSPRPVSQPWLEGAVSTAEWTGVPLRPLLEQAGIRPEATEVVFTGADAGMDAGVVQRYQRSLRLAEALSDDVLLAYRMNGAPLPPQHGFPLRLVVPGWYGMASVKWLARIELVDRPFEGHYMVGTYRYRQNKDERGDPVTRQQVRALMVPPGIPDFYSRIRLVEAGRVLLEGRAWAGPHAVASVEVSVDGGGSWQDAELEPLPEPCCWQAWRCAWRALPGRHTLMVRASDASGAIQPIQPAWNRQGMGNNVVQRVEVLVA
jgi:DMSO/TMAO reductase YedYZ molybdopterin-dependent catalytic subunit